jgi:hypothetical protein
MRPKRLTGKSDRMFARSERNAQWALMERIEREGVVWMCPWDKNHKHGADGVYVFGLLGSNELFHWLDSHKDWWERGEWADERCAFPLRITDAGRSALQHRYLYDMEPIEGGMVDPGYIVTPWPASR